MKLDRLTTIVFGLFLVAFFGYDLWTINARGFETSFSAQIYQFSFEQPAVPFVFRFFAGHLFFGVKANLKKKSEAKKMARMVDFKGL